MPSGSSPVFAQREFLRLTAMESTNEQVQFWRGAWLVMRSAAVPTFHWHQLQLFRGTKLLHVAGGAAEGERMARLVAITNGPALRNLSSRP